ncbi:MAG: dihydroorotate dehydrogenase-like protein [Bacteroidales bacterium]|jgi:dihydroorotate dehydrogenase (fumarate)|nr:dihydroorotate dehydrogenase-like protein [Bacteroidales bacterium]
MTDLSVTYMGLKLKSPLILGSCGLSNSIRKLQEAERAGFGAVVLKSIFEEEISREVTSALKSDSYLEHSQSYDYISQYQEQISFDRLLNTVRIAKESLSIPVIASINCFSTGGWMKYAKAIEEAGADALEVNYFVLPADFDKTAGDYQAGYFKLVEALKRELSIPIGLKTSSYFTDLAHFMQQLSYTGIAALVLFNRFHSPDINLDTLEFSASNNFSRQEELANTLRWVGLLSEKLRCDLSATTGVHDAAGMIKLLLAGADTVQAASVFYQKGIEYGAVMLNDLKAWMDKHEFSAINDFKAKLNYTRIEQPDAYFRIQFMKYMSGIE